MVETTHNLEAKLTALETRVTALEQAETRHAAELKLATEARQAVGLDARTAARMKAYLDKYASGEPDPVILPAQPGGPPGVAKPGPAGMTGPPDVSATQQWPAPHEHQGVPIPATPQTSHDARRM